LLFDSPTLKLLAKSLMPPSTMMSSWPLPTPTNFLDMELLSTLKEPKEVSKTTQLLTPLVSSLLVVSSPPKKIGLDKVYQGVVKADGAFYKVKKPEGEARRPFKVLLDVGLTRTTTGSRVFAAMKGAVDGGLYVPHNPKRFPADKTAKGKFSPKQLRKYIYGGHIADYMTLLKEKNPEKYKSLFTNYIKAGKNPADLEKMWTEVHANIRKSPAHVKVVRKTEPKKVRKHKVKKNNKQRKNRVTQKLSAMSS